MAQLAATVYVTDPDSHQTVELAPGTCPEPRLAALVTNPAAWVDGKLPRGAVTLAEPSTGEEAYVPLGTEPVDTPPAKKSAARKTAATKPARGRDAADEGSSSV